MNARRWLVVGLVVCVCRGHSREPYHALQRRAGKARGRRPPAPPDDGKLRIIVFGAHPDDSEIRAGGSACLWADAGHHVKLSRSPTATSATGGRPAARWPSGGLAEVQQAAKILGNTAQVLDIHDGELEPTLENRRTFTRLIRQWKADIVIAHRPNDYHPDHRYTGVLVQDAAYMVTVPFFCPDTPPLKKNPVFLYSSDALPEAQSVPARHRRVDRRGDRPQDGRAGRTGLAVRRRRLQRQRLDAAARRSGPEGPAGARAARRAQAAEREGRQPLPRQADRACTAKRRASKVRYAEAFEICEYGRRPTPAELRALFPFVPQGK